MLVQGEFGCVGKALEGTISRIACKPLQNSYEKALTLERTQRVECVGIVKSLMDSLEIGVSNIDGGVSKLRGKEKFKKQLRKER